MTAGWDEDEITLAAATASPPMPGPGEAPGNAERTAIQEDPGSIGGGTIARPRRYLVVARHGAGAETRYLFARWPDWPHPAMVSVSPPAGEERLDEAIALTVRARFGVETAGGPHLAARRIPARMLHPRTGVEGLGWIRPVAVDVSGEPRPDALLEDVLALDRDAALAALPTDLERIAFRAAVEALEAAPAP